MRCGLGGQRTDGSVSMDAADDVGGDVEDTGELNKQELEQSSDVCMYVDRCMQMYADGCGWGCGCGWGWMDVDVDVDADARTSPRRHSAACPCTCASFVLSGPFGLKCLVYKSGATTTQKQHTTTDDKRFNTIQSHPINKYRQHS